MLLNPDEVAAIIADRDLGKVCKPQTSIAAFALGILEYLIREGYGAEIVTREDDRGKRAKSPNNEFGQATALLGNSASLCGNLFGLSCGVPSCMLQHEDQ